MASFFSNPKSRYEIRSISLPVRSHPTTVRIDEELNKLKKWEAAASTTSAEKICNGLIGLNQVYKCLDEILNLPITQKALSVHYQNERWIDESLDSSVRLLDVCSITRDFALQTKEHVKDLESAIRTRKGDSRIEISIAKYFRVRKGMKEGVKKLKANVKQIDNKIVSLPISDQSDNPHVFEVIRVLGEVSSISITVYNSVFVFFSAPISEPKSRSNWCKLLDRGSRVACEEQKGNGNELESVDLALKNISKCGGGLSEGETMRIARDGLEQLEAGIESIENGLECLFKGMIKTRASLLNIVSL